MVLLLFVSFVYLYTAVSKPHYVVKLPGPRPGPRERHGTEKRPSVVIQQRERLFRFDLLLPSLS